MKTQNQWKRSAKALVLKTVLILTALSGFAAEQAMASPIKSLFLGYDYNTAAVKTDILGSDARFDLANSSSMDNPSSTPSLATMLQYDSILVWTNYWPSAGLGNALADYVDAGGHVVLSTFMGQEMNDASRINTHGYNPFTNGTYSVYNSNTLGTYDHTSPLFNGVSSVSSPYYNGDWTGLDVGATLVASWASGTPFVGVNAIGNVIAISLFPNAVTYGGASGDYQQLFRNALAFNSNENVNQKLNVTVPEPSTVLLFGIALAGLVFTRRTKA